MCTRRPISVTDGQVDGGANGEGISSLQTLLSLPSARLQGHEVVEKNIWSSLGLPSFFKPRKLSGRQADFGGNETFQAETADRFT